MRKATIERKTKETRINVSVELDGDGRASIITPLPFLNHLIKSLATHSLINIDIVAEGDLKHHLSEDISLCLGEAIRESLAGYEGIRRFGYSIVPMDDSIARVALDQGNRPYSIIDLELQGEYIEELPTEDIIHFIKSLAISMKSNIHINVEYGDNDHHKVEAAFKALALALRESISLDPRKKGVPSSKGMI